jgi:hypothetical protein
MAKLNYTTQVGGACRMPAGWEIGLLPSVHSREIQNEPILGRKSFAPNRMWGTLAKSKRTRASALRVCLGKACPPATIVSDVASELGLNYFVYSEKSREMEFLDYAICLAFAFCI